LAKTTRKLAGLPLRDATIDLVINVTPKDVRAQGKKSNTECAAAVAICRQQKVAEARVYLSRTYVKKERWWDRYVTPAALRTELVVFDRTGQFDVGEYRLMAPSEAQQLGYRPSRTNPNKKGKIKARAPQHVVAGVRDPATKGSGDRA